MAYLAPSARLPFDRGAEHLHRLGARAIAEALIEIADKIGGGPAILATLTDYRRISPKQVRAVGGDRFPQRLTVAPGA